MQFNQIPGQESIKMRLMKTVKDNRISHAQLFYGPDGSGKLALAIAYAQFISCSRRIYPGDTPGDSCGECPSCLKYQKLIHPDLHFFFPTVIKREQKKSTSRDYLEDWRNYLLSNNRQISLNGWYDKLNIENKQGIINAEDCSNMIKTLNLKPYESEYKVLIIWMVEKLYYAAAPKLLKALEEPPPKTLFVLVCENHDQVLNTIISRTQLVKVPKFDDDALANYLKEKNNADVEIVNKVIPLANGNILEAKTLIETSEDEKLNFENFRQLLQLCYKRDIGGIAGHSDLIAAKGREKIKSFLNYGIKIIRYTLLANTNNEQLVRLEGDELKFVKNLSSVIKHKSAMLFTDEIDRAIFHIERNGAARIVLLDMSLSFIDFFRR